MLKKKIYLLEKLGHFEDCLLTCEDYLTRYEQDPFIVGKMGMFLLKLGDYEESISKF